MASAPREDNRVPSLVAKSDADNTPVILEADAATKRLKVSAVITSGGSGTADVQYTDGATAVTHPVGTQPVFTNGSNVVTAVSTANPLPVSGTAIEDAPHTSGDTGVFALGVRNDTVATLTNNNGDYSPIAVDMQGRPLTRVTGFSDLNTGNSLTDGTGLNSHITDGTNAVNVLKSDGTFVAKNGQFVAGTSMELGSLAAGSLNADIIPSTDISPYSSFAIQITGTFSGTLTFQQSNDNTNFVSTLVQADVVNNNPITSTTVVGMYHGNRVGRYLRVRMTAYTSGTATGTAEFFTVQSLPYTSFPVGQQGTWTVSTTGGSTLGSTTPTTALLTGVNNNGVLGSLSTVPTLADGVGLAGGLIVGPWSYNNSTWDRFRNNTSAVVVAAGATTTQTGITFTTYNAKRLMLLVNITSGAGTVTVAINATSASGYVTNLLTSTALTGVGTTPLRIFDGATPSANLVANDSVPRTVSVTATVTGTIAFGIDYILGV